MAQPAMADPVALYEGARDNLLPALAGVKHAQLGGGTPCTEWNVQQLMVHNIKVAEYFFRVITGDSRADRLSMFEVDGPLPAEGIEAAFEAITNRIINAARAPGALDTVVSTVLGEVPVARLLAAPITDMTLHKWDLAKATGQDTTIDSSLAEVCYHNLAQVVEGARQRGTFGSDVTVPMTASIQEKLLGLSGRQP